ncbi:NUDIX hydrolase domain-like protein [Pavlovales sp. CCMP2436]|nr:NUDIX hydrolase domain-like protein [Pavlovales sp. CCMP2436]
MTALACARTLFAGTLLFVEPAHASAHALRPALPRVGRALVRASGIATPLGQDPSELFELYHAPCDLASRLPAGAQPLPLGTRKRRGEVHRDGDWHRSVHVWLVDESGGLLLQQRSVHKDTYPGRWDVSAAGHLSAGAAPLETAKAEVRQELGLELGLDVLSAGWVGTLPSCATGETRSGPFVCNEFQELFVIRTTTAALDALELDGMAHVLLFVCNFKHCSYVSVSIVRMCLSIVRM